MPFIGLGVLEAELQLLGVWARSYGYVELQRILAYFRAEEGRHCLFVGISDMDIQFAVGHQNPRFDRSLALFVISLL